MSNEQNRISKKYKIVVSLLHIFGYGSAIICALVGFFFIFLKSAIVAIPFWIYALVIAVATWFACLSFEAIAEGLQLLQDIKNK